MKNETITTYERITRLDGFKLLVESGGNPVKGMAMKNPQYHHDWKHCPLDHCYKHNGEDHFINERSEVHDQCAKVTELDPCMTPFGCPELEPWMAYIGTNPSVIIPPSSKLNGEYLILWDGNAHWETGVDGSHVGKHHVIDVRKGWCQREYPEHCRIRADQEPKPELAAQFDEIKGVKGVSTCVSYDGIQVAIMAPNADSLVSHLRSYYPTFKYDPSRFQYVNVFGKKKEVKS